jgi:hypothetical protein
VHRRAGALLASSRAITRDETILRPAAMKLSRLIEVIEMLTRHILVYDEAIAKTFAEHPKALVFASLPGAGAALASRLLTLFGERTERYPDDASVQNTPAWPWCANAARAGLECTGAGPRRCFALKPDDWAAQTVPRCTWAAEYYQRQKAAGKRHNAILRALAFKWVRILWRNWKDHTPYDENRHLAALAKRHFPKPKPA